MDHRLVRRVLRPRGKLPAEGWQWRPGGKARVRCLRGRCRLAGYDMRVCRRE